MQPKYSPGWSVAQLRIDCTHFPSPSSRWKNTACRAGTLKRQLPSSSTSTSPSTCFTSHAPELSEMGVWFRPVSYSPPFPHQPRRAVRYSSAITRSFFTVPRGMPFRPGPR